MVEKGRKSYLGPPEIEPFVYCFLDTKGSILRTSYYGSDVDQGN